MVYETKQNVMRQTHRYENDRKATVIELGLANSYLPKGW